MDEKLEILHLLSQFDSEERQQIMIIMTYWQEMIDNGIVDEQDINSLSKLSNNKQQKIKEFVTNKLKKQVERNKDGKKKEES